MAMYFAALPPEINSGRMYAGPGSGPMMAASAAWDGLASDLYSTATCYQSAISVLTGGSWLGPAAGSMAAAAAPYTAWITATAAQAEQAATQAKAAAAAYEAAFAMTVPPPVIAANRSLLLALVATNFFGQNVPAIAATEAHYGEMWAQDAAAMYGYAGASAAASTLTPFTPPPQVTNAAGLPAQAAAVAQAAGTPAGTGTGTIISAASQLTSAVPNTLQELASGAASDPTTSGLAGLVANLFPSSPLQYLSLLAPYTAAIGTTRLATWATTESKLGATGGAAGGIAQGSTGLSAGGSGTPVTADVGRAASIGGLTVPQSWTAAAPTVRLVAATSPTTSISAAPAVGAGSRDSLLSDMAAASMAGRAMTGTVARGRPRAAVTMIVVRHPSAG